jgi:chromosome segregation ATPase
MGILFGGNPREPINDKEQHIDTEYQLRIENLQAEIVQARAKLKEAQARMTELQNKLEEYQSKERQISEVMINAQINAQKFEAQARAKAEILIQELDEELRRKNQELELLRIKAQNFKQELSERIDQYRSSIDLILEPSDDVLFTPTLVSKDKKNDHKLIG